ncbi:hypothetical protein JQ628_11450 [Bradyrhizobium lablabi]|uniref:hypothetical protein n=1 Tax=Bradyrhizobium lablabi TaxID=722472 RepID=UPI001BAC3D83|nr:hypothetical protein [Bradyrhizobium lablabi]MBR1122131.1 hypothetical protein [Bradyrhizobium lablabi]
MTQLHNDVGQMAFGSIGFHAALIINRLRTQAQLTSGRQDHDEDCEWNAGRERNDEQKPDSEGGSVDQRLNKRGGL